jgi:hypothetical protein
VSFLSKKATQFRQSPQEAGLLLRLPSRQTQNATLRSSQPVQAWHCWPCQPGKTNQCFLDSLSDHPRPSNVFWALLDIRPCSVFLEMKIIVVHVNSCKTILHWLFFLVFATWPTFHPMRFRLATDFIPFALACHEIFSDERFHTVQQELFFDRMI